MRKAPSNDLGCRPVRWRSRSGTRVSNGTIETIILRGGGHVASWRFLPGTQHAPVNALWEAPWETGEPSNPRTRRLARRYGAPGVGEFLASFTGHAVCMDYFGAPSADEVQRGLSLHGEAGARRWQLLSCTRKSNAPRAKWRVRLPAAGLTFSREIHLPQNESVICIRETVRNERGMDHYFHWVQHVTLGTPLLEPEASMLALSGTRGKTWPLGYEGKSLIAKDREFRWPHAPREKGGTADLSRPFSQRGKGFVASVLLDTSRKVEFVAALNWRLGIVAGYCFSRQDFPWVAVWEENCVRRYAPWNGQTQARGMEFGTTPMPIGKQDTFLGGNLFDVPGWCRIPAGGMRTASYLAFLASVPKSWQTIHDVRVEKEAIVLHGPGRRDVVRVHASGVNEFGW
jgi:hypothetical protein